GVPLHVPTNREKVTVVLRRQGLVAALVDGATTGRGPVDAPSPAVGQCKPVHEPLEMSVLSGLQHQVKMIRHQTVRENVDGNSALRLDKGAQTGIVIFGTFEET